jgi:hypothetical protein
MIGSGTSQDAGSLDERRMSKSAEIRAWLGHPVIDADGHWIEYGPALNEYVAQESGKDGAKRFWSGFINPAL